MHLLAKTNQNHCLPCSSQKPNKLYTYDLSSQQSTGHTMNEQHFHTENKLKGNIQSNVEITLKKKYLNLLEPSVFKCKPLSLFAYK